MSLFKHKCSFHVFFFLLINVNIIVWLFSFRYFPLHPFHCLHGVFSHLCACQCAMSTLLCICSYTKTLLCVSLSSAAFPPLFFSVMCLRGFFFCLSHLCSCHVPVPVHQWASALSTRSLWPQMSEQAAARQAHFAACLCFASSHPSTSCSVMLTVIESK